jgi:hypothetical protein
MDCVCEKNYFSWLFGSCENILLTIRESYNVLTLGEELQRWAKGAHVRINAQEDTLKDHFEVIHKKAFST